MGSLFEAPAPSVCQRSAFVLKQNKANKNPFRKKNKTATTA